MSNISVRTIDEETMARLRQRAAAHGVSMEEEARRIIAAAVMEPARLGDLARDTFCPAHAADIELPERKPHTPVDLGQ